VADVTEAQVLSDDPSVTYAYYFAHIKPKPAPMEENKKGFVCKICGYVYGATSSRQTLSVRCASTAPRILRHFKTHKTILPYRVISFGTVFFLFFFAIRAIKKPLRAFSI
jgi:hypothetical protein